MVHVNGLGDSLQLDVEPIDVSYFCKLTPKVSIALLSLAKKKQTMRFWNWIRIVGVK